MEQNSKTLKRFLNSTLLPLNQRRREVETALYHHEGPKYALAVLHLVAEPSVDEQIRHLAALNLTNQLKLRWSPAPFSETNPSPLEPIPDAVKENIKTLIVSLMIKANPKIQMKLSEAFSVIGQHDFPGAWPTLLPKIAAHLDKLSQTNDYVSINGLLATVNSLFMKFRYTSKTNELPADLKYCLDNFAEPLLEVFKRTANLLDQVNGPNVKPYIKSLRLCCSIFYSLNFQELPEFFENHMGVWTVENISLHTINEEEFQGSLSGFVEAIEFLTTVSKSSHHTLFSGDDILQHIFQSIIIPNVMLQNEDEVLFEMNPIEFIRRDMEGSNIDTKRRIACELLKGIAMHYKDKVAEKVTAFLDLYAFNPIDNWRYKDCAIYLVLSLATKNAGGTSVSTDVVDLQSFFEAVIVPELQDQDVLSFPMLKAGALKFFTSFRNQISKPVALTHLPDVIMLLNSTNYVVRSYAAICIEKHLLVKDDGSRARYTEADIYPFLQMLMNNLFGVILYPESEENQYVMKCIMRVVCVAVLTPDVASLCIGGLITVLDKVCQNPKNPVFNHYLFESLSAFIRRARWVYEDTSLISLFERNLFPRLQMILASFITEFFPYSLQLLAQLVDLITRPLPVAYVQIIDILSLPDMWSMSANAPALVCLLKAFMQKAPQELNKQGRLSSVLGMSNMLVSFSTSEDRGFYVLNSVIENLGFEVISPYVSHIWVTFFHRLQNNKTVKFVKNFIIFMSLFLVKYGSQNLVSSVNAVQPDVFQVISKQFWIPNLKLMTGPEFKLTSVASTRLICDSPDILDIRLWGKMLDSIMTLFSRPGLAEQERVDDEPEIPEFGEIIGYNTTSTRLYNAGKKEEDPLKKITDPRQFLVMSLSNLFAAAEGKYPQVISENLEKDNQAALLQLCNSYKVSIV